MAIRRVKVGKGEEAWIHWCKYGGVEGGVEEATWKPVGKPLGWLTLTKERIGVVQSQEGLVGGGSIDNVVISIPRGGSEKDLGVRTGELKASGSKVESFGAENPGPTEKGGYPATSVKRRLLRVWVRSLKSVKPARMRWVRMSMAPLRFPDSTKPMVALVKFALKLSAAGPR